MKNNIIKLWGVLAIIIILMISGFATGYHESSTSLMCDCQKTDNNNDNYDSYAEYATMTPIPIDTLIPDNIDLDILML